MSTAAAAAPQREMRLGDQVIRIEEPNAFKLLEATEQIGAMSDQYPELMAHYDRVVAEHVERNAEVLERDQAIARYPALAEQSDAWWAEQGGRILIPGPRPDVAQVGAHLFKPAWKVARDPLLRLITVLAMPNAQLAAADEEKRLDDAIADFQRKLLHQGRLTDLAVVIVRSLEGLRDEFAQDSEAMDALGELRSLLGRAPTDTPTPSASSPAPSSPATSPDPGQPAASPQPTDAAATSESSSTPSPATTTGPDTTSSSPSAGTSSAPSDGSSTETAPPPPAPSPTPVT